MNQTDVNIKFTWQSNKQSVSFLDTLVYRTENNTLVVWPFNKETDHNNYLHFCLFHPATSEEIFMWASS